MILLINKQLGELSRLEICSSPIIIQTNANITSLDETIIKMLTFTIKNIFHSGLDKKNVNLICKFLKLSFTLRKNVCK